MKKKLSGLILALALAAAGGEGKAAHIDNARLDICGESVSAKVDVIADYSGEPMSMFQFDANLYRGNSDESELVSSGRYQILRTTPFSGSSFDANKFSYTVDFGQIPVSDVSENYFAKIECASKRPSFTYFGPVETDVVRTDIPEPSTGLTLVALAGLISKRKRKR